MGVIEEVADKYLPGWKHKSEEQIGAPCPFHVEKTPGGFFINRNTGLYFCHGCLASGNLIMFLKEMGAPGALIDAAASIMEETAPRKKAHDPHYLNEELLGVFDYCPTDLVKAGFAEPILREHEVGFDKEYMRITFPIRDLHGRLVGISGRSVVGERPKYLAYLGEDLKRFNPAYARHKIWKSDHIWRMHYVYPKIFHGQLDTLYIVEGYKACMWMVQMGRDNTVALQGIYLSNEQLRILQRLDVEIAILLDNTLDARKATLAAGERLRKTHRVFVCEYPDFMEDGAQPDDMDAETLRESTEYPTEFWRWKHGFCSTTARSIA